MATVSIDIQNQAEIQRLIDIRRRELGETTKQAASAIMVNCLKSLRADTRTANEKKLNFTVTDVTAKYRPSHYRGGRCFRSSQASHGNRVEPEKGWWVVYAENAARHDRSYVVTDGDIDQKYLVVCHDAKEAKDAIKQIHQKRVRRYKGLARAALSMAQYKLAQNSGLADISNARVKNSGFNNMIEVRTNDSGFNSGEVAIYVHDMLRYAADALKSGPGFVETALQQAMNKTVGYVMQKLKAGGKLTDSLRVELEDLKR